MNILILSWRDPKHPLAGGAEQMVHQHSIAWKAAGHRVTLFSSRFKGSIPEETISGIKILRKGHQYLGVQLAALFYYIKNSHSFDLVIDQFHGLSFFTPLYVRKPKLALIHELARELWFLNILPRPFNTIAGTIGYLFEPFIFLLYRNIHFLTVSNSTKKDLSRFGIPKKNITVILNGVTLNSSQLRYKKDSRQTVVFLGTLTKDKGVEDALICFDILNKRADFKFWIIGKADRIAYLRKLKNLSSNLQISNKIRFWGFVSEKKKFELLARSHLLVNPSVREGWGLVNIEANSVQTPVIAYKTSGLVDSVKGGYSGVICQRNNPDELANEVYSLISNKKKYQAMQKNAYLWSKNFSWEKARIKSLRLIKKIIYET